MSEEDRFLPGATGPEGLEGMIRPLDANGWNVLELWLQRWPIERAKGVVQGLTQAESAVVFAEAAKEAKLYWFGSPMATELLYSFSGASMWWWLSRVLVEESITKEQARTEVNAGNLHEIIRILNQVNGFKSSDPTKGAASAPTQSP